MQETRKKIMTREERKKVLEKAKTESLVGLSRSADTIKHLSIDDKIAFINDLKKMVSKFEEYNIE